MSDVSKLLLSDEELQLVNNTHWILTKRIITGKVDLLLGDVAESLKPVVQKESDWLPEAVIQSTAKIAKGENYLQLPYLLLDYPRCFDATNIFAVRTMFWWGNFFSVTLQLSGTYKEKFQQKIFEKLQQGQQDYFICINESQWQHHFESTNYIAVKQLTRDELQEIVYKKSFIKLAQKFSLHQWNDIPALLHNSAAEMITILKD